jgi:hypothetical protein
VCQRVPQTLVFAWHEISKNGHQEFREAENTHFREGGKNGDANAGTSVRVFSGEFNFLSVVATRGRVGVHGDIKFEGISDGDIRADFAQFENIKPCVENVDAVSLRRDFNFLGIVAKQSGHSQARSSKLVRTHQRYV